MGPRLEKFFKSPSTFCGESLKRPCDSQAFSHKQTSFCVRLIDAINERFEDLDEDIVTGCKLASFATWPEYGDRDAIRGMILLL